MVADVPRRQNEDSVSCTCLSYVCDPNGRPYKYAIAILISFIQGTLTYCADAPGGIQSTMIRVMHLDNTRYSVFFSAYTWPDIAMSALGSIMINQCLGIRFGLIFFTFIVLLGQIITSIGAITNDFWIALSGRVILGSGVGSTFNLASSFQILWFKDKEISFVMSIGRSVSRLMATLALFTPQMIYDGLGFIAPPTRRLGATLMVGACLCVISVCCALIIALLDKHGAKIIGRKTCVRKNAISIQDVKEFPGSFWVVLVILSVYYAAAICFTAIGSMFFVNKYNLSLTTANLANSLSYASVVFITPLIGLLIDLLGYNLVWGLGGIFLAIISQILYVVGTEKNIFIPFLSAGLSSFSYTLFGSAIWVLPGFLVPTHQATTAYGVTMSVYAFFFSVVGALTGVIIDYFGYLMLSVFYLAVLLSITLLTLLLALLELCSQVKVLNISGCKRKKAK